jgi:hypothetical protein
MVNIKVISNIDLNFGAPINELFRVWAEIIQNKDQPITLDFRGCRFSNPFFLQGIYLLYRNCRDEGMNIEMNLNCNNEYFANYLNLTYFRGGFQPDKELQDIATIFDSYRCKTYLPLTNFPVGANDGDTAIRDKLLEFMSQRVRERLQLDTQLYIAITYLIDEAVNNIKDHARTERGYLFTQFYPKKGFLDLCIADIGISLLGSYHYVGRTDITNHEQAIQAALSGDSTKNNLHRGFGIRTSRNMLVNGLSGRYFLLSGNSFLFSRPGTPEEIKILPQAPGISWPGTYIAMRIPVQKNANFNYSDYIE